MSTNENTNEKRERAIRIIRAMLNRTTENGCTPQEASDAAAKAQELLRKYQLDMVDVVNKSFDERLFKLRIETSNKNRDFPECVILNVICLNHHCQLVVEKTNQVVYNILGYESDVEVVKSIFLYVIDGLNKSYKYEKKPDHIPGKTFRNSYMLGASVSIDERLKEQFKQEMIGYSGEGGNALMVLKMNSLAEIKKPAVEKFVEQQHGKLKDISSKLNIDKDGYEKGKKAGKVVELNRKIS